MHHHTQAVSNHLGRLAKDARALAAAAAGVAEVKAGKVRKRLVHALQSTGKIAGDIRARTVEGARAADEAVHEHSYQTIGIALGAGALIGLATGEGVRKHLYRTIGAAGVVGAIIGFLVAHRHTCNRGATKLQVG